MAFDAETTERTVTRDRVMRLRDFMAVLPPEQFDMRRAPLDYEDCGTPACMLGWARRIFKMVDPDLGLTHRQHHDLFQPRGWQKAVPNDPRFPPTQAVAVLDHYLATGEIDWSVTTAGANARAA